jgi:hypothetical protein
MKTALMYMGGVTVTAFTLTILVFAAAGGRIAQPLPPRPIESAKVVKDFKPVCIREWEGACFEWSTQ